MFIKWADSAYLICFFQLPVRVFFSLAESILSRWFTLFFFLLSFLVLTQLFCPLCGWSRDKSRCCHWDGKGSGDRYWACRTVSFWDYLELKHLWIIKIDFSPYSLSRKIFRHSLWEQFIYRLLGDPLRGWSMLKWEWWVVRESRC